MQLQACWQLAVKECWSQLKILHAAKEQLVKGVRLLVSATIPELASAVSYSRLEAAEYSGTPELRDAIVRKLECGIKMGQIELEKVPAEVSTASSVHC